MADSHAETGASGVEIAPGLFLPAEAMRFTFVRGSGPGGQNVNKRSTKVRLSVSLSALRELMGQAATARLIERAGAGHISRGRLVMVEEGSRSQHINRQRCVRRLSGLVRAAMVTPAVRKRTRPKRSSVEQRMERKKRRGETKRLRRKPDKTDGVA